MTIRWRISGRSDRGRVRRANEDRFETDLALGVVVLADGMGGHSAGDVASDLAVETALRSFRKHAESGVEEPDLTAVVREAQLRLADAARADPRRQDMGTTLVLAHLLPEGRLRYAYLGDSRIYRLRDGSLRQLTRDHTMLERERAAGRPGLEGRDHPYAHVLVRSLMASAWMAPEVSESDLLPGDLLLIASDGLTGMLDDDELLGILDAENDLDAAVMSLITRANDAGGHDNITTVLVRVEEGSQPESTSRS